MQTIGELGEIESLQDRNLLSFFPSKCVCLSKVHNTCLNVYAKLYPIETFRHIHGHLSDRKRISGSMEMESPRSACLYPLKICMDSTMINKSQVSHSVTDLPKVSQIPCDPLEEHEVCSAHCLWVHCLLAQYTSSQKCFSIPRSTGGRRTGAVSLPLLYTEFFPWPEQFLITG